MRLELKQIANGGAPPPIRSSWTLERGRRTLGRAADCDWQVPADQRSVSKLHCTIERDREGFLLRDQSANGSTVNGVIVHEGEVTRLSDRARLEIGKMAFSVHISGEKDHDVEDPDAKLALSDEPLTISAILADIAPGGRTATGILGERVTEDWSIPVPQKKNGAASSRNVEIGWSGPPEISTASKILPDDWNSDGSSEFGSHLEHGAAPHVSAPAMRVRPVEMLETVNDNSPPEDPLLDAFPRLSIGKSGELAQKLEPLLGRLEESLADAFAVFEIEQPQPAVASDIFGSDAEDALVFRVEILLGRQMKFNAALEGLLREAGRMEPRILESHVDAGSRGMRLAPPWGRNRDYWQAYKAHFEKHGSTLSIREFFRDAMMRAMDAPEGKSIPIQGDGRDEE